MKFIILIMVTSILFSNNLFAIEETPDFAVLFTEENPKSLSFSNQEIAQYINIAKRTEATTEKQKQIILECEKRGKNLIWANILKLAKAGDFDRTKQELEWFSNYDNTFTKATTSAIRLTWFANPQNSPKQWTTIFRLREQKYFYTIKEFLNNYLTNNPEDPIYLLLNSMIDKDIENLSKHIPEYSNLLENKKYREAGILIQKFKYQYCMDYPFTDIISKNEKIHIDSIQDLFTNAENIYKDGDTNRACELLFLTEPFFNNIKGPKKLSSSLRNELLNFCMEHARNHLKNNHYQKTYEILSFAKKFVNEKQASDKWHKIYLEFANDLYQQGYKGAALINYQHAQTIKRTRSNLETISNLKQELTNSLSINYIPKITKKENDIFIEKIKTRIIGSMNDLINTKKIITRSSNNNKFNLEINITAYELPEAPAVFKEKASEAIIIDSEGNKKTEKYTIKGSYLKANLLSSIKYTYQQKIIFESSSHPWSWGITGWEANNLTIFNQQEIAKYKLPTIEEFQNNLIKEFCNYYLQQGLDILLKKLISDEYENINNSIGYENILDAYGKITIYNEYLIAPQKITTQKYFK